MSNEANTNEIKTNAANNVYQDVSGSRIDKNIEGKRKTFAFNIDVEKIFTESREYFEDEQQANTFAKRRIRNQFDKALNKLLEEIRTSGKDGINRIHLQALFAYSKVNDKNVTTPDLFFEPGTNEDTFTIEVKNDTPVSEDTPKEEAA